MHKSEKQILEMLQNFENKTLETFQFQVKCFEQYESRITMLETSLVRIECALDLLDIKMPTNEQLQSFITTKHQLSQEVINQQVPIIQQGMKDAQALLTEFFKSIGKAFKKEE